MATTRAPDRAALLALLPADLVGDEQLGRAGAPHRAAADRVEQLTVDAAPREGATPAATPPAQRFTLSNTQTAKGVALPATGNGEAAR